MPLYHRRAKKSIDKITKNNSEQIPKFVQNAGLTLGQGYVNIYLTKGKKGRNKNGKVQSYYHSD
jgi:mRNA-degrading endonuclease RelE of RelBE toxin-antitoxin system